jgi:hypothetical protein
MARAPGNNPTSRLTLDLPLPVRVMLNHLRASTNAESLVEVVRRAILVYEFIKSETADGGKLIIRKLDGTEREVVIL